MPAKKSFEFSVSVTKPGVDPVMKLNFSPGSEDVVVDFLLALMDNRIYTECIEELQEQMQDPKKTISVQKICGDVVKAVNNNLETVAMRPSQVLRGIGQ